MRPDPDLGLNPEARVACCLLLDTSSSMVGEKIDALNAGLQVFYTDLSCDPLASLAVEVCLISFGSTVNVVQDWVTVDRWVDIPTLTTAGKTHLGEAVLMGLDTIDRRVQQYVQHGVQSFTPWCFLITDGEPQGEPPDLVEKAAARIRDLEAQRRLAFFAVGVEGANMERLAEVSLRQPVALKGLAFNDMFLWLSSSLGAVSRSRVGDDINLDSPSGWAKV